MLINLSLALAIFASLWPVGGFALSLGGMITKSALNEQFQAEIELRSATAKDIGSLRVSLASPAAFERSGVDRPFLLNRLRFKVAKTPRGRDVIKVTSRGPVREPYLVFLLEVNWPKGRVLRKFTTLLDPAPTRRVTLPVLGTSNTQNQAPSRRPARAKTISVYGPIRRGATLSKIAHTIKANGVSARQVAKALFRNNPSAFVRGNINRLRTGVTLRLPESATSLVRSRSNPSATPNATPGTIPNAIPSGGQLVVVNKPQNISGSSSIPPSASATGNDKRILEDLRRAQETIESNRKEAEELRSRMAELGEQLREMRQLLELKSQQLAQAQTVENPTANPQVAPVAVTEQPAVSQPQTPNVPAPVQAAQQTVKQPVRAAPQAPAVMPLRPAPSAPDTSIFPTQILNMLPSHTQILNMLPSDLADEALIGGGILILVIAALGGGMWLKQRYFGTDDESASEDSDIFLSDSSLTASGLGMLDEHASSSIQQHQETATESDFVTDFPSDLEEMQRDTGEVDPASEADVYIAYGRYQQAETLITQTLDKFPDRLDLKLKLLEIYFTTRNVAAFSSLVEEMDAGNLAVVDAQAWGRVCSMGQELLPGHALFAGTPKAPSEGKTEPRQAMHDLHTGQGPQSDTEEDYSGLDSNDTMLSEMPVELAAKTPQFAATAPEDFGLPEVGLPQSASTAKVSPASEQIDSMFDPVFKHMDFSDLSSIGDMLGDFDLSTADTPTQQSMTDSVPAPTAPQTPEEEFPTFDLGDLDIGSDIDLALADANDEGALSSPASSQNAAEDVAIEDVDTKLALARAYMDLDVDMARDILEEVISGGDQAQQTEAQDLLTQLI